MTRKKIRNWVLVPTTFLGVIYTVGISGNMAGCILKSLPLFMISTYPFFLLISIYESIVIFRFKIFGQFFRINDKWLYTAAVFFVIFGLFGFAMGIGRDPTLNGILAIIINPIAAFIEASTGYLSRKLVLRAFDQKEYFSAETWKLANHKFLISKIFIMLTMLFLLMFILLFTLTELSYISKIYDMILTQTLLLCVAMSSLVSYQTTLDIIQLKADTVEEEDPSVFSIQKI